MAVVVIVFVENVAEAAVGVVPLKVSARVVLGTGPGVVAAVVESVVGVAVVAVSGIAEVRAEVAVGRELVFGERVVRAGGVVGTGKDEVEVVVGILAVVGVGTAVDVFICEGTEVVVGKGLLLGAKLGIMVDRLTVLNVVGERVESLSVAGAVVS